MLAKNERRSQVIVARVTYDNKKFIQQKSKELQLSEGTTVDKIIELVRTTPEGKKLTEVK